MSKGKEIVVAEPTGEGCSRSANNSHNRREYTSRNARPFTRSITWGRDDHDPEPELFDSEKLPVSLVSEIQRFLRVANLIETEEPRVAYLCKPFLLLLLSLLYRWLKLESI